MSMRAFVLWCLALLVLVFLVGVVTGIDSERRRVQHVELDLHDLPEEAIVAPRELSSDTWI